MRWSSSEIRWEAQAFVGIRKGLAGVAGTRWDALDSLAFDGIR